jgi:hypothetical protein
MDYINDCDPRIREPKHFTGRPKLFKLSFILILALLSNLTTPQECKCTAFEYTTIGTRADSSSWYSFSFDESDMRTQRDYVESHPPMSQYLKYSSYSQEDFGQCFELSPQHFVCQFVINCTNLSRFRIALQGFSFPTPIVMFIYDPNSTLKFGPIESTDARWTNREGSAIFGPTKRNQLIIEFHSPEPIDKNDVGFRIYSLSGNEDGNARSLGDYYPSFCAPENWEISDLSYASVKIFSNDFKAFSGGVLLAGDNTQDLYVLTATHNLVPSECSDMYY